MDLGDSGVWAGTAKCLKIRSFSTGKRIFLSYSARGRQNGSFRGQKKEVLELVLKCGQWGQKVWGSGQDGPKSRKWGVGGRANPPFHNFLQEEGPYQPQNILLERGQKFESKKWSMGSGGLGMRAGQNNKSKTGIGGRTNLPFCNSLQGERPSRSNDNSLRRGKGDGCKKGSMSPGGLGDWVGAGKQTKFRDFSIGKTNFLSQLHKEGVKTGLRGLF